MPLTIPIVPLKHGQQSWAGQFQPSPLAENKKQGDESVSNEGETPEDSGLHKPTTSPLLFVPCSLPKAHTKPEKRYLSADGY